MPGERVAHLGGDGHLPERQPEPGFGGGGGEEVHRGRSDETGDEEVRRRVVQLVGRADLLGIAAAQDHHPISQRHGLGLVVSHVDGGGAQSLLQSGDLGAHLDAQFGVEVAQRLVHQKRLGLANDGPPHRHSLTLPAGQLGRLAVEQFGQVEDRGGLVDLGGDLGLAQLGQRQREGDVLTHGHVRVEGVGLKHHGDVTVAWRLLVDACPADAQLPGGDVLQARDHVEGGRLSATGRSDEDDELAVGDGQRQVAHRGGAAGILLGDVVQNDLGHYLR